MKLIRVKLNQFNIGDTIDCDIYDSRGQLILKHGAVITSGHQLLQLTARGYYEDAPLKTSDADDQRHDEHGASHQPNPFTIIEDCAFRLGRIFFHLSQSQQATDEILDVCHDIGRACAANPDATLGAVHLLHGHAYTTIHPIHTAVLVHFLCTILGAEKEETLSILAAALTSNISMLELQEILQTQDEPLSAEQKMEIQNHPTHSMEILKCNGVTDELWINIVHQHHERISGDGYPHGLIANDIVYGAKIIAVADAYSAMISPRIYRETNMAKDAQRKFLLGKGSDFDESLCRLLVKNLGVFPPGSFVKLANNDTAIVIHRSSDSLCPTVASVLTADGSSYLPPVIRDTRSADYFIQGMVPRSWTQKLDLSLIWGYL